MMTARFPRTCPDDPEIGAERQGVFDNAIGAIWLAYIGGAIDSRAAGPLDRALRKAAARRLPPPLWEWPRFTGEMMH